MKRILSTLLVGLSCYVHAQPDIQTIDSYLRKSIVDWEVPGMAVAIIKDGKAILSKGYGVKQKGKATPIDENTLFSIASNTKAFTASALAILVQEGKLGWNDRVRDYLPYFELYDPYVTMETRIVDLLCHRVGLGTFSGDMMWYKSSLSVPEILKKAKHLPQAYGFRNGYGYSNLMYIAAGEVIRAVSGKDWNSYVQEVFLTPLNMQRTITSTDQLPEKGNYAMPHKSYESGPVPIDWVNWDQMGAAGGIISSVSDMTNWVKMNLEHGIWNNDTLISRKQQNKLWTSHNTFVVSEPSKEEMPGRQYAGYGLGWGISDYHGNMVVSHSGGYDGMYSRVFLVPNQNLGIVILTNGMKGITYPLCYYILNQFIEKDMRDWSQEKLQKSKANKEQAKTVEKEKSDRVKKLKAVHPIKNYVGTYYSKLHGNVMIKQIDDELMMKMEDNPGLSATLTHWHYNVWKINWKETHAWFDFGTIQFLLDNNLEITGMHFDVPNYDIFFDEVDLVKTE